jgi:hypothetical protein
MPETYVVHLPTRREGPYDAEQLRELLATGRVRSTDEVMVSGRRMSTVAACLPDALDLSRVRPPTTERIRRKSSDRHAAVERKSSQRLAAIPSATPAASAARKTSPAALAVFIGVPLLTLLLLGAVAVWFVW